MIKNGKYKQVGHRVNDYLIGKPLTDRELTIARLITQDMGNIEIGCYIGLSTQTVKNHITACLCKLGLHSRVGLAVWYVREYGNPFRLD